MLQRSCSRNAKDKSQQVWKKFQRWHKTEALCRCPKVLVRTAKSQQLHRHRTTKVSSWLVTPVIQLKALPKQDCISPDSARAMRQGPRHTKRTPVGSGSSHLPAWQEDSQNPPTYLSTAMPLLPAGVGRRIWGMQESNFLTTTSVHPHCSSLISWPTPCHPAAADWSPTQKKVVY